MGTNRVEFRDPVHRVSGEVEAIQLVHHGHIKRSRRGSLFFISADVEVVMAVTAIAQSVNQPWVAVISEDHWFIRREDGIKFAIRKTVRMLTLRLQGHQVDNIDYANFEIRKM